MALPTWNTAIFVAVLFSVTFCTDPTTTAASATSQSTNASSASTVTTAAPTSPVPPSPQPTPHKNDDNICGQECNVNLDSTACQICSDDTFSCPKRQLKAVCRNLIHENTTLINVADNNLRDFSSFSGTYPKVITLKLCSNKITRVTKADLARFPALKELDLSHNTLASILLDDVFETLTDLEELTMDGMSLYTLPENIFAQNKKLKFLSIQDNKMQEFPGAIFKPVFNRMTTVNVNGNPITKVSAMDFENVKNVENLNLERLSLMTIDPHTFSGLSRLRTISLDHNTKLSFIHEEAFGLQRRKPGEFTGALESVTLRACALHVLDRHTFDLRNLKEFGLSGNPWYCDCGMKWMVERDTFANAVGEEKIRAELQKTL